MAVRPYAFSVLCGIRHSVSKSFFGKISSYISYNFDKGQAVPHPGIVRGSGFRSEFL